MHTPYRPTHIRAYYITCIIQHTVQSIILDWQCPTCSLWFAAKVDRSKRERHLRIHTGVRHLACPEPRCGEMFSDTSDRNVHYHSVHLSAPKKIECSFCGGHYAYKYSLDRHMIRASHPFADCVDQAQDVVASTAAAVSNPKLFVCREPKCGCTFANQGNCFHHYRFSHTVLKKVSKKCKKRFFSCIRFYIMSRRVCFVHLNFQKTRACTSNLKFPQFHCCLKGVWCSSFLIRQFILKHMFPGAMCYMRCQFLASIPFA